MGLEKLSPSDICKAFLEFVRHPANFKKALQISDSLCQTRIKQEQRRTPESK